MLVARAATAPSSAAMRQQRGLVGERRSSCQKSPSCAVADDAAAVAEQLADGDRRRAGLPASAGSRAPTRVVQPQPAGFHQLQARRSR